MRLIILLQINLDKHVQLIIFSFSTNNHSLTNSLTHPLTNLNLPNIALYEYLKVQIFDFISSKDYPKNSESNEQKFSRNRNVKMVVKLHGFLMLKLSKELTMQIVANHRLCFENTLDSMLDEYYRNNSNCLIIN